MINSPLRTLIQFSVVSLLSVFAVLSAQALETQADFMVLMDSETGQVLAEKRADERMAPASMSKLMTTAMVFEALKVGRLSLDDTFHVSEKAWRMEGSKMWTLVNTQISVRDLLRGVIIQSGNDACVVLAEGLSGSEDDFARAMTKFGKEIGLTDSTFKNSTGWPDPEHRMTARDLATLSRHIIETYPNYYKLYSEREFTWSKIKQENRNRLLWENNGVDGLKTGHTEESGYGLVSSAVRNGRRLILVVNGLPSEQARVDESRRLLEVGFREFESFDILAAGQQVANAPVFGGTADHVPLVVKGDKSIIMSRYDRSKLIVKAVFEGPLQAPVAADTQVGVVRISAPGKPDEDVPLYTQLGVGRMGPLGALNLAVKSFVSDMFDSGSPDPASVQTPNG